MKLFIIIFEPELRNLPAFGNDENSNRRLHGSANCVRHKPHAISTAGTKAARRVRAEANKLTEQQREDLFKRGMQIVYGGTGSKETVGAGH